ncbi:MULTISPECIES: hypothetical protein [Bacillus cereus group]|uniref:Uncharacterized protein n=2 Tax=Bacillus cereus group TaxID=86661 RepID=A0A9W5L1A6_BACCE|nr:MULTISPECIES: hypothetical protein [Bacillus cereus group]ALZ60417.1 hypothetical protein FORC13_1356 [Bacillus cereus]EJR74480.1 hypothetical protein IK5_01739 [Bacillus cereus VD154]KIU72404.1 hypothetical protein C797_25737 [Bacillus thuringiensis Sbt003]MEB8730275.1 hypothetical protein [Bacillus cereus]MEB8748477.1 hypothetical protein [Bacillus cereus]
MTVHYMNHSLEEYKELVRLDVKLISEIMIAKTFADYKKLEGIRIKIIEASFVLKHKWENKKATT